MVRQMIEGTAEELVQSIVSQLVALPAPLSIFFVHKVSCYRIAFEGLIYAFSRTRILTRPKSPITAK